MIFPASWLRGLVRIWVAGFWEFVGRYGVEIGEEFVLLINVLRVVIDRFSRRAQFMVPIEFSLFDHLFYHTNKFLVCWLHF